jgi:hypothetical protein
LFQLAEGLRVPRSARNATNHCGLLVYSIRVGLLDASPVLTFASWSAGALPVLVSLWLYLTSSRTDHGAHPDPATDADNFAHAINADIRREYERCNIDDGADPCDLALLDAPLNTFGTNTFPNLITVRDIYQRWGVMHTSSQLLTTPAPMPGRVKLASEWSA